MNNSRHFMTTITHEITTVTIPVAHFRDFDKTTCEDVSFRIFREGDWFKAVPLLPAVDRKTTGIPEELLFVYWNHVVLKTNASEDESMEVIKNLILDLEVQGLV